MRKFLKKTQIMRVYSILYDRNEYLSIRLFAFHRIVTNYRLNIEKSSATLETVGPGNMQTNLLNLAQTSLKKYKFQYLTAISFNRSDTIIAWFNNQALHTASLALDLVHNAMMKTFCGDDHSIHVTNAPLKFQPKNDTTPDPFENIDGFGYLFASAAAIVMAILSASYIAFYIKVRKLIDMKYFFL